MTLFDELEPLGKKQQATTDLSATRREQHPLSLLSILIAMQYIQNTTQCNVRSNANATANSQTLSLTIFIYDNHYPNIPLLLGTNHTLRQESPNSTHDSQHRTNRIQKVAQDPLPETNLFPKDLQVEHNWQYNANRKAERATHKRHNAVKCWKNNADNYKHDDNNNSNYYFQDASSIARETS